MSQNSLVIANVAGASYRSNVNSALDTLLSLNSGATAPATTQAYMWWMDTTTGIMKQRNAANSDWINRWTVADAEADGSWTPTATAETGSITSYTSSGSYKKIGKLVFVRFSVTLTNVGTSSNQLNIGGLPFTAETISGSPKAAVGIVREDNATGVSYQSRLASAGTGLVIASGTGGAIAWTNGYIYSGTLTYISA